MIKKVEERLGQQVELGGKELFGHRIEIVADQRLLQLANVAESVISHFDRAPFVLALCNGSVATAVMGGSNVDYRWIVRTAPSNVQTALLTKASELMATNQSLALRAADYLLFWICSEDSIALREDIPEELSFRSRYKKLREEDGCDFSINLWSEENYLDYLQRTKLSSINIAENLADVAINPDCTMPEEFSVKFDSAIHQIEYKANEHRSQTREDIAIEHMEPALCAYKAERYAELFRKLTTQLNGQNFLSCLLLAGKLYKQLPVLTELERESIIEAWRMTLANTDKEAHSAELTLFPMVVFDRSSDEQFLLLQERGGKTGYISRTQARYREITATCLNLVLNTLNGYDGSNPETCYAVLDYLIKTLSTMDHLLRERLLNLLQGDNSIIRYLCLEIIYNTNDHVAANAVLESAWKIDSGNCDYENDWGSILLAHFAKHISFEEIADRISLRWLGYAVKQRGNRPEEVAEYALRLHIIWTRIAMQTERDEAVLRHLKISICQNRNDIDEEINIDLNENFGLKWTKFTWGGTSGAIRKPFDEGMANARLEKIYNQVTEVLKAEKKRGNHWIDTSFSNGNLDAVVASGITYWREWIKPVMDGTIEGRRLLAFCQGLYESLCATLLNLEPETGVKLFNTIMKYKTTRIVDSYTDIQHILFSLFEAQESPSVIGLWNEYLNSCDSDKDLSEIAYLAQTCGKNEWIDLSIQFWLSSERDYDIARGLRLLGFSNEEKHAEQLNAWIADHGRSWLMDVAKTAQASSKRNSWARIWIERFVADENRVKSWASFRLFLRCADKRFWIWDNDLIKTDTLTLWKRDAYRANIGTILDAVKENEKKLKDKFIGHDVKENQLWPWMKRYGS